jgi:hypothetical protein
MAESNFNIDYFRQTAFRKNLARKNRFEVMLPFIEENGSEGNRLVSAFCQTSSFAPLSIENRSMRIQGPAYVRGMNVNYGGSIPFTFLVDTDFDVHRYFQSWAKLIIEPSTFSVGYFNDYAKDIEIFQLDEDDIVTFSMTLKDAFPTNIGMLELNQSAINEFHTLAVSFTYRYWETAQIVNSKLTIPEISGPGSKLISLESTLAKASSGMQEAAKIASNANFINNKAGAAVGFIRSKFTNGS